MDANVGDELKYIIKGQSIKWDPPRINVGKYLLQCMNKYGSDRIAQLDPITKEEHTYDDIRKYTIRTALHMRDKGVDQHDFVTLCASNHLYTSIPFIATLYLGAIMSPIHCVFSAAEYERMLSKTRPKLIFCDERYELKIINALKTLNLIESTEIVVFERNFNNKFLIPHPDENNFQAVDINDDENHMAVLVCTSGSSGVVKAVPLTHRQYFVSISFIWELENDEIDILLLYSPISWGSGFKILSQSIITGACRVVTNYQAEKHLRVISEYKVTTYFSAAGKMVEMIRHPDFHKYNIPSHVKRLIYGGSPVSLEQTRLFRSVFKNTWCMNGYGSTEMCGTHAFFELGDPNNEKKEYSCGKLINEINAKVIDIETGDLLGRNQIGELLFKSPYMMKGYYKDPEETAKVIDKDGWFHTGDLGFFDDDDYLFCIDRIKEILKYQHHHVSPSEVENVILEHPGVAQVCVVGKKHDIDGFHPTAFIVKRSGYDITEQDILNFTEDNLIDIQKLRGGVRFVEALPMTASGKVKRMELRKILDSE